MLKLKNKITNPMTVIAIFAVISETSAAVSLPFLANKEREIYVWFLISFPFYLLFLFFLTLNFNYRSLYAPSDFDKDKNFLKAGKANTDKPPPEHQAQHNDPPTDGGYPGVAETRDDVCRPHNVADPPDPGTFAHVIFQHFIHLPATTRDLHFVDARQIKLKSELAGILLPPGPRNKRAIRIIVMLSCHTTNELLKRHVARQFKHAGKGTITTLCIIYNVCSQELTVLRRR
ncbi:hypothetical protein SAMN04490189_3694 [Pseudomonas koreensis]|uniref:hypothetical protein n=1 Tax=Pseudomonas koreensis TaxID=198620 RepID=UPI00087B6EDB|nr:hypothetical protein [Pseudomonas koreensis]KAB0515436.1 hypothetical protein F7R05_07235 [Pseudomonas koreensis]NNA61113.1 hypothetical protein [Pseudomonas koreensis]GGK26749.1 hypothetical protein GCM10009103_22370 [Pseudomonas koreensis]SDD90137.1 hypothetical protein SAMN04490189_3694 [Pseudomonas koreensis]